MVSSVSVVGYKLGKILRRMVVVYLKWYANDIVHNISNMKYLFKWFV